MTESSISKIRVETTGGKVSAPHAPNIASPGAKLSLPDSAAPKKVFIKTFGCQMNEYDSNRMLDSLNESHGVEATQAEADADIILLNTCSVREKAQEKVFHQLGRWKHLKNDNPDLVIGVGGCVASQEGDAIMKRAPFVDMVFGPQTLHKLPQMYEDVRKNHSSSVDISFPEMEKFDNLPAPKAVSIALSALCRIRAAKSSHAHLTMYWRRFMP